ncbi:Clavaminate synthase-like protein [Obba rivulosa]|uniref:Clavaminate synthase-like protein n=1 Tax=Obba rivulosa TaxID=1052685 RepID=A0A8E2DQ57_9APHY|nr:Clavaminate synthase-like protein [Obba rivulosa]
MPGLTVYPPFPEDVPTAPLLIIDYALITAGDEHEKDRLFKAARELGFWYLKNHGADEEVDGMFDMGLETMRLPLQEKMKFEQGDGGLSFGYKAAGASTIDEKGTRDANEFLNIAKDDVFAWPAVARRTYPETVNARMTSTIGPFIRKAVEVNTTLINALNDKLGLPEGTLAGVHRSDAHSASASRFIRTAPEAYVSSEAKLLLPGHTDYGSLSFLHNRLGGLQVRMPVTDEWLYVKPLPGHAVCNVGDALTIFSAGILRSNIHRVVPPPSEQKKYERHSLVYFTRPEDSVILRPVEGSQLISQEIAKNPEKNWDTSTTSKDWVARRISSTRAKNYKSPEAWKAQARGTETDALFVRPAVNTN